MAFKGTTVSVPNAGGPGTNGGTQIAPLIAAPQQLGRSINDPLPTLIYNTHATSILYLGGVDVSNTSFPLPAGSYISLDIGMTDILWGLSSAGTISVGVLVGRQ
jgi:hypothetical protein